MWVLLTKRDIIYHSRSSEYFKGVSIPVGRGGTSTEPIDLKIYSHDGEIAKTAIKLIKTTKDKNSQIS